MAESLAKRLLDLGVTVKVLTVGEDEIPVLEFGERATREQATAIRDAWLDAGLTERVALVSGARIAAARYEDVREAAKRHGNRAGFPSEGREDG